MAKKRSRAPAGPSLPRSGLVEAAAARPEPLDVLIATHGPLAGPDRPVSGVALRAEAIGDGLAQAGLRVGYLISADNLPSDPATHRYLPYGRPEEAAPLIEASGAAVVILCHWELLEYLPEKIGPAVVVDLYAPRLLEARYQGTDFDREVPRLFTALSRADRYLCTTERLRQYWLGLLTAVGIDLREPVLLTVPLSLVGPRPPHEVYPGEPVFVMGGVFWPWNDHSRALGLTLETLEKAGRGTLCVYGGRYPLKVGEEAFKDPTALLPASPRLRTFPMISYPALLEAYRRASVAIDVSPRTPERELSFSFRGLDYLSSGLPVIATTGTTLGEIVEGNGLGWPVSPDDPAELARVVASLLERPAQIGRRGKRARDFALARFRPEVAVSSLAAYCRAPARRPRGASVLASLAKAASHSFLDRERRLRELEEFRQTRDSLAEKENERVSAIRRCDELGWELARVRQENVSLESRAASLKEDLEQRTRAVEESRAELAQQEAHRAKAEAERETHHGKAEAERTAEIEKQKKAVERERERAEKLAEELRLSQEKADAARREAAWLQDETSRRKQELDLVHTSEQQARTQHALLVAELERAQTILAREKERAEKLAEELRLSQEKADAARREAAWQQDEIKRRCDELEKKQQEVDRAGLETARLAVEHERAQTVLAREKERAEKLAGELRLALEKAENDRREASWQQDEIKRRGDELERKQQEVDHSHGEAGRVLAELERAKTVLAREKERAEKLAEELRLALERVEAARREGAWQQDEVKRRGDELERKQQEVEKSNLEASRLLGELERVHTVRERERERAERLQSELRQSLDRNEELHREVSSGREAAERISREAGLEIEARDRSLSEVHAQRAEAQARLTYELGEHDKARAAALEAEKRASRAEAELSEALTRVRDLHEENQGRANDLAELREAQRRERAQGEAAREVLCRQRDRALKDAAEANEAALKLEEAILRERERADRFEHGMRDLEERNQEAEGRAAALQEEAKGLKERAARERERWEQARTEGKAELGRIGQLDQATRAELEVLRSLLENERALRSASEEGFRNSVRETDRLQKELGRLGPEIELLRRENRILREESTSSADTSRADTEAGGSLEYRSGQSSTPIGKDVDSGR